MNLKFNENKYFKTGLEIYDGHTAFAVEALGVYRNAPRIVRDLRPRMACPF